jgi:hypothetical protein
LALIVGIVLLPGMTSLCGTDPSANVTLLLVKGLSKFSRSTSFSVMAFLFTLILCSMSYYTVSIGVRALLILSNHATLFGLSLD